MSPGRINSQVATGKLSVVREMLAAIERLPLGSFAAFLEAPHVAAAAESYLRRALEALLDLGRHILAKGFGVAASEYADVPRLLREEEILSVELAGRLKKMAGYRNRLVHLYDQVTDEELYGILTDHLHDVTAVTDALRSWMIAHPDRVAGEL